MRVLILGLVVFLGGCATAAPLDDGTPDPTVSPGQTPQTDLATGRPSPRGAADGEEITGVLGADAIEGGCAYLRDDQGTNFEVLYPDGWEIQVSPLELTDPDGTVVATGGETITVRGREATDMVSICQIGPMFQATEVVSVD